MVFGAGYMFVPAVMVILVQKFFYKENIVRPCGVSLRLNRWFLIAWLLPAVVALIAILVAILLPGVEYSSGMQGLFDRFELVVPAEQIEKIKRQLQSSSIHPVLIGLILGLIAGITINAVAGFGEELGWRGFLQKELSLLGFWKMSLIIGVLWGIWHWPIVVQGHNYYQHPHIGVFMMIAFCALLSPIFSYIRIRSGSVIAAAIMHGSLNGTAGLSLMCTKGGSDLTIGVPGAAGFIVLCLVLVLLFVYDRFMAKEPVMKLMLPQ